MSVAMRKKNESILLLDWMKVSMEVSKEEGK